MSDQETINSTMQSLGKAVAALEAEYAASPKEFYKASGPLRVQSLKSSLAETITRLHRLPNHMG